MSGISNIKNKIMVMSGKGGVGKSTVSVNLAITLKNLGYKVGLLDIDIHGPSIPFMLNLDNETLKATKENTLLPVDYDNMKVISIGFLLDSRERAVIWRGALKHKILMQFLNDVEWGELDYLIIDSPPGTGDEPLSIMQNIKDIKGTVIVSTPQDIALIDVEKAVDFCIQMQAPVLGVVENMAGFKCANCGEITYIFGKGGHKKLHDKFNVELLAEIPIVPTFSENADKGVVQVQADEEIKKIYEDIAKKIIEK